MNRTVVATSFAVAALTLLAVQVVNRFGYQAVEGILILLVVAAVAFVTVGADGAAGAAIALVVFYALSDLLSGDRLAATVILAALAVVAALVATGRRFWR